MSEPNPTANHVPYIGDDQNEVLFLRSKLNAVVLWFNLHEPKIPEDARRTLRTTLERAGKGL